VFGITETLIYNEGKKVYDGQSDYILLLGAGVYIERPSPRLMERLNKCLEYARYNENAEIIVSGGCGSGERITESEAMENYLVRFGIDEKRIIKEDKSTNTYENMKNAKRIIEKTDNVKDIKLTIITADFHMFRSKLLAGRVGFRADGIPAETTTITAKLRYYVREFFAVYKSILFDRG
jgi:uncharacterized SAM-binding protein YcdF (DUF218 family)